MKVGLAVGLVFCASPIIAEQRLCADGLVAVDAGEPLASLMCQSAERAVQELARCNLPLKSTIDLTVSPDLERKSCVGVYHCGENRIEVLPPEILESAERDTALFYGLDATTYFQSVIFHEIVHAAYDGTPCPFGEICRATTEYLAYSLQIRALDEKARATMQLTEIPEIPIRNDEINLMILFMAPDTFATKSYTHLMQQPDPCAFVGEIAAGRVYFDYAAP